MQSDSTASILISIPGDTGPVLNNGGGALTFTGANFDGSATLDDPTTCSGCMPPPAQAQQFDAGTFAFNAPLPLGATPEPGTLLLLGIGLTGVARTIRRKALQVKP